MTRPVVDVPWDVAWEALVHELARRHSCGRVLVAVDGADAAPRFHFANTLARAVRASGRTSLRLTAPPLTDDDAIRAVLTMFDPEKPRGEFDHVPEDAMLIVDGWPLLRAGMRDAWHFTIMVDAGRPSDSELPGGHRRRLVEDAPYEACDAAYDLTDIDHPVRIHAPAS